MDTVIFAVNKETDVFERYYVVRGKTPEEMEPVIKKHNEDPAKKQRYYIVTDPHVVAAIGRKIEIESIEDMVKGWQGTVDNLRGNFGNDLYTLSSKVEEALDYIKENYPK